MAKFRAIISPVLNIRPTGRVPNLNDIRTVLFTSRNGVRFGGRARKVSTFCVGEATTAAAQSAGWPAKYAGATADELVDHLIATPPESPILHIAGVHRRGNIAARLSQAGVQTGAIDVYDQLPEPLNSDAIAALCGGNPVIVPLFSPRAARQFTNQVTNQTDVKGPLHILALSDAVMEETSDLSATTRQVASEPNAASMVGALEKLLLRVEADDTAQ